MKDTKRGRKVKNEKMNDRKREIKPAIDEEVASRKLNKRQKKKREERRRIIILKQNIKKP